MQQHQLYRKRRVDLRFSLNGIGKETQQQSDHRCPAALPKYSSPQACPPLKTEKTRLDKISLEQDTGLPRYHGYALVCVWCLKV